MWNLYHLKYFSDAATKLSITDSAKINNVSVSAVSQAIRSLESQLGAVLLEHRKKDFYLTSAGRVLLAEATDLLERMDHLRKKVVHSKGLIDGTIRIACSNAVAQSLLPGVLVELQKSSLGIRPIISIANARRTRELVANREVDLALAVHESPLSVFESTPILKGQFVFAQSKIKARQVPFEKQHFITGDMGEEIDHFKVEFKKKWGREPEIVSVVQSWTASLSLTCAGMGASLVPDFLVPYSPGLICLKSPLPLLKYKLNLYFRKKEGLSEIAELFVRVCTQESVKNKLK
ncbi:MAG: LysR family transcriptional regulator [Bdellovibrionaceae bacterium]|nr:LysR family transcriptional regulator [Pseudobdellovibrionaceae bacterium]